jgi:hypothetical protein
MAGNGDEDRKKIQTSPQTLSPSVPARAGKREGLQDYVIKY